MSQVKRWPFAQYKHHTSINWLHYTWQTYTCLLLFRCASTWKQKRQRKARNICKCVVKIRLCLPTLVQVKNPDVTLSFINVVEHTQIPSYRLGSLFNCRCLMLDKQFGYTWRLQIFLQTIERWTLSAQKNPWKDLLIDEAQEMLLSCASGCLLWALCDCLGH